MKKPIIRTRWFLSFLSVVGTLTLIEVFLAIFFPVSYMRPPQPLPDDSWRLLLHRPSDVPGLAYELAPNRTSVAIGALVETNSYGLRDDELRISYNAPQSRITVVGDSFTFGYGVEGHETYPNVLEDLLNQSLSELPFEVLNFGVSGYSTYDEAIVIEHKVLQWQPDLIIVGYVLNDPEIDPVQPIHQHFQATEWWQHSNILRLAFEAKNAWDIERLGDGNYIRYLHAPEERKWSSVLDSFENIARLTNEREIPVLVVIFPRLSLAKTWSDYPFRDLHAQVASAANEQGFFVIDLYDEYSKYPSKDLRAAYDNAHPGPFANQLAAQEIYNWLSDHPEMLSVP